MVRERLTMDKLHDLALEAARQILGPDPEFPELIALARQLQQAAFQMQEAALKQMAFKENAGSTSGVAANEESDATDDHRLSGVATDQEIQQWALEHYGFKPETCWIAHCKEIYGLPVAEAPNRQGEQRVKLCPPERQLAIKKAFEHFWHAGLTVR
jgi:hypothetical protein